MENKDITLSILIPVFNTEEYLEECIDSLLHQNLKDYEIIMINDGSTDSSKKIIHSYMEDYPFIRYYEQTNSGQGTARNVGIDHARGKYIYFMDSDDYLVEYKLNKLLNIVIEENLDGIFFEGEAFLHGNVEMKLQQFDYIRKKEYGCYSSGELLLSDFSLNNDLIVQPCLYIVKKSVLIDHNLYFPDKYKHEDEFFSVTLFLYLQKVCHVKEVVFRRRVRENSTMTNVNKTPSFVGYVHVLSHFDEIYTNFDFLTVEGKKAYRKKMSQLTKAAFTSHSQVTDKSKVEGELEALKKFAKKYRYFGPSTYGYVLMTKNETTLEFYRKATNVIKKLR